MSQTDKKYIRSSKNCFSSNCSSGHVECSFQDTSEKFSITKCQTNFAQCPKRYKMHTFFNKLFFLKLFLWTCGRQFWQLFGKFGEKGPKSFCSMSQTDKKYIRSSKNCFSSNCSSGHVECSFQDTSEKFSITKCQTNFAQCPKRYKMHTFFNKLFFLKLFLWTSGMQFWKTLQKFFEKRPKCFCSRSQKVKKT